MKISKISSRDVFVLTSFLLTICCIDQLYMMCRYGNIKIETFILTLFFTCLNIYFGFKAK
ncbi:hypothetical protein D7V86_23530 [bacterium D16-51]|nr:hypothetical protein D7V96_21395 [bacterium D16-59]RKI54436.1 hypothetical protein D7V86_23530 [bacterium D16-51]